MRRDYVTVDVSYDRETTERPTVALRIDAPSSDGPAAALEERLRNADGDLLGAEEVDVAYRLQSPPDRDGASGVFSVTNRFTGEYVLEANVDADDVFALVDAVRDDGGDDEGTYRIEIDREDEPVVYEKRMLLVYDTDGNLLRGRSLIPSGVEL